VKKLFCRRPKPSLAATRSDPSLEIRARLNLFHPMRRFEGRNIVRADALLIVVVEKTRDIFFLTNFWNVFIDIFATFFTREKRLWKTLHAR
jgi:hypothetical protein